NRPDHGSLRAGSFPTDSAVAWAEITEMSGRWVPGRRLRLGGARVGIGPFPLFSSPLPVIQTFSSDLPDAAMIRPREGKSADSRAGITGPALARSGRRSYRAEENPPHEELEARLHPVVRP